MNTQPSHCSRCLADFSQEGCLAECGHAFCLSCLTQNKTEFVCPLDGSSSKPEEVVRNHRLCETRGTQEGGSTTGNTKDVHCPAGIFCPCKSSCPYQHSDTSDLEPAEEEDLFQSMIPAFPDQPLPVLTKSDSARSGVPSEVLNEYLDIEGDDTERELANASQDYLQAVAHTVAQRVGTAYQWLLS